MFFLRLVLYLSKLINLPSKFHLGIELMIIDSYSFEYTPSNKMRQLL